MPRVKTIRPGRLTGITGLTQEASRQLGKQKDIEYATALSDWQAEKTKLEGIKQDKLNYLDQKMKMIAGEEQAGGATFDEGFKKAQMEQAKEYANIVSDIKLGNIDAADGYAKLAVFDQSLKNIETAIPNINAFNKKVQEAMNKEEGEVGSFMYDGSGKTFEIAQLFNDMYSPTKSGNVSTVIEDGKTFLIHKDGQKISIEGLNAIMSGENPDYPINFVQDPREALKAVHDVMMKENDSEFKIRKGSSYLDSQGRKVTTKKDQYYLGKGSNYNERLSEAVMPILNDNEKMKGFWLNLGGEGNWNNSEAQRSIAKQALIDMAKNYFGPKNDVISVDISLPKDKDDESKRKDGKENNFDDWIKQNLRGKKKQQVKVTEGDITKGKGGVYETETEEVDLDEEDQKQIFYEKLVTENPRYVFGSQIDMTGENANKIYQRIGNTTRPFSITDEQIKNDEYLNNLLVSEGVL